MSEQLLTEIRDLMKSQNDELAGIRELLSNEVFDGVDISGGLGPVEVVIAPAAPAQPSAAVPALGDPAAFFDRVRGKGKLWARLLPAQVEGCEILIDACFDRGFGVGWAAYVLATAFHETAFTMQPIKERGGDAYLSKYDTGRLAARLGNSPEADGDGQRYAGRGYVQLTGRANYLKASDKLGVDLIAQPDLALNPDKAALIICDGMEGGWFTAQALGDFIPKGLQGSKQAFRRARAIVNGSDDDDAIAGYALEFQDALIQGLYAA